jgi:hypothetical protein
VSVEVRSITGLLNGSVKMEEDCGSTSEIITTRLGADADLSQPYLGKAEAWDRFDTRQRNIVRSYNSTFRHTG